MWGFLLQLLLLLLVYVEVFSDVLLQHLPDALELLFLLQQHLLLLI